MAAFSEYVLEFDCSCGRKFEFAGSKMRDNFDKRHSKCSCNFADFTRLFCHLQR